MADEENNVVEQSSPDTQKKNPFIHIMLLINALGLGGIAFMQFQKNQQEMAQPSLEDVVKAQMQKVEGEKDLSSVSKQEEEGPMLPLEGFVANMSQGDGPRRYVSITPVLKFNSESNEEEINTRKPQIRDTIIGILNAKRPEDLLQKEGRIYLKEEIKSAINSFMINGAVIDVYYVSFQIK